MTSAIKPGTRVHPEWIWWPAVQRSLYSPAPALRNLGFRWGSPEQPLPPGPGIPSPVSLPTFFSWVARQMDAHQAGWTEVSPPLSTRTPGMDIRPSLPSPGLTSREAEQDQNHTHLQGTDVGIFSHPGPEVEGRPSLLQDVAIEYTHTPSPPPCTSFIEQSYSPLSSSRLSTSKRKHY